MNKKIFSYIIYFITISVEIFRLCVGSLFLLILPQNCGSNICTYQELIFLKTNDTIYFIGQLLNYTLFLLFLLILFIEHNREYILNKYYIFDHHFYELDNSNLENKTIDLTTLFRSKKSNNFIDIYSKYNKAINNQLINITELINTSDYLNDLDNSNIYESLYETMNEIMKKSRHDYSKINDTIKNIINIMNKYDYMYNLIIKSIYILTNYEIFNNDNNDKEYIKNIHKLFINNKDYKKYDDRYIYILKNELNIYFKEKEHDIINNFKNDFIDNQIMIAGVKDIDILLDDITNLQTIDIQQNKKNYIVSKLKYDNNNKKIISPLIKKLIKKSLQSEPLPNIAELLDNLNKQLYDITKTEIDEHLLEKKLSFYHEWLRFLFEIIHVLFPINVILSGYITASSAAGYQTLTILFTNLFFMFSKIKHLSRIVNSKYYLSSIKTIPYEYNNFIDITTSINLNDNILTTVE